MGKTVKKRSEIDNKYKWNLEKMVEAKSFDELYQEVIQKKEQIQKRNEAKKEKNYAEKII